MPVITMFAPPMTEEQKKELIRAFAEDVSRILAIEPHAVNTTILEVDPKNVGVGPETLEAFLAGKH